MKWQWKIIILSSLVGCSHADKKIDLADVQAKQDKTIADFEKANKLLDEGNPLEAAKAYDKLIINDPTDQLNLVILFNSGVAYFEGGYCDKAGQRFRQVIRIANKINPSLKARASLRMSDIYTCLGEDNKSIANLVELYRSKNDLADETKAAEIPAKLAAAYARNGNNKEAENYFRQAEKGLLQVQIETRNPRHRAETLSRILFLMGDINQLNTSTMKSADYLATIRAMQKYLYKSVEFNGGAWSRKSAGEIVEAYLRLWDYIKDVPAEKGKDVEIDARHRQIEQLHIAQMAVENLKKLYSEHIPDSSEPEIVAHLMDRMKKEENKFRNYIATNIVGTQLTKQALEAESVKREGRVLNPDPILERQSVDKNNK